MYSVYYLIWSNCGTSCGPTKNVTQTWKFSPSFFSFLLFFQTNLDTRKSFFTEKSLFKFVSILTRVQLIGNSQRKKNLTKPENQLTKITRVHVPQQSRRGRESEPKFILDCRFLLSLRMYMYTDLVYLLLYPCKVKKFTL